ncbi:Hypothetical predicted protein [Drosophila guanche]|uniref:Uncharacterized protein n=1 Tax=Drosophila guanche TaxID=7266 RepID=A0A3B0JHI9_DROGU|nr:Hypothetical predicted protein [Drosophila guanche]
MDDEPVDAGVCLILVAVQAQCSLLFADLVGNRSEPQAFPCRCFGAPAYTSHFHGKLYKYFDTKFSYANATLAMWPCMYMYICGVSTYLHEAILFEAAVHYSAINMPRKKNEDFYKKYGFTAKCENGKYSATCLFCQKELQNTALTRLSLHRQTCDQKRALSETQSMYLERRARPSLRITHEDADGGIDHGNEGKEIIVKIQEFLDDCEDDPDADGQGQQTVIKCEVSEHCSPHINSSNEDYQADAMEYEITGVQDNREYVEFLDEYKEVMVREAPAFYMSSY